MAPPGLAWLQAYCISTGIALGQGIVSEVSTGVNQLTYRVKVSWREPVKMSLALQVWNLFQKWAGVNKTAPQGQLDFEYQKDFLASAPGVIGFTATVQLRERLGPPPDERP